MEYKQVIIVCNDLNLPKGKLAAQVAHASVDGTLNAKWRARRAWRKEGQKKVVLKVRNQDVLLRYAEKAKSKGLPVSIIRDAGKTVVKPGTITCAAIGPANAVIIDEVTKRLPVL